MNQEKIGNFIKTIRKDNNMTQSSFAKKYNVTYQAVSNWEKGKNLPDISLLKQISKDFNVSIDDLLEGKKQNNNKRKYIILILVTLFLLTTLIIYLNMHNDFEFKTLSSNCSNFNISGSISYNSDKTSIYINNVNYCGGNDETKYKTIECILYETNSNIETKISTYNYNENEKITLEDFLKKVNFTIDDYKRTCKSFSNDTLYLKINATNEDDKITTYNVPLKLNETCDR